MPTIRALKRFACDAFGPEVRSPADVLASVEAFVPRVAASAEEMAALLRSKRDGRLTLATGQRVAIIGAGPAGLSAAHDLALLGFAPVVFESEPTLFRLAYAYEQGTRHRKPPRFQPTAK